MAYDVCRVRRDEAFPRIFPCRRGLRSRTEGREESGAGVSTGGGRAWSWKQDTLVAREKHSALDTLSYKSAFTLLLGHPGDVRRIPTTTASQLIETASQPVPPRTKSQHPSHPRPPPRAPPPLAGRIRHVHGVAPGSMQDRAGQVHPRPLPAGEPAGVPPHRRLDLGHAHPERGRTDAGERGDVGVGLATIFYFCFSQMRTTTHGMCFFFYKDTWAVFLFHFLRTLIIFTYVY